MKKNILLAGLFTVSVQVSATQIFAKNSDCVIDDSKAPIEIYKQSSKSMRLLGGQEASNGELSDVVTVLFDDVRLSLFDALSEEAKAFEKGIIIKNASFKRTADGWSKRAVVSGKVVAQPVLSCHYTEVLTAKNTELISGAVFSSKPTTHSITYNTMIDPNKSRLKPKLTEVLDTSVTTDQVFGIKLGDSFSQAEEKIGRFTMQWPINAYQKFTFIGRNNVFLFEHDKLVGYQYAFNLLPISLANLIDIYDVSLSTPLSHQQTQIANRDLDEMTVSALKEKFPDIKFFVEGRYTTDPKTKLSALTIGKTEIAKPIAPACWSGQEDIKAFITKHQGDLMQWRGIDKKTLFYTGCNQLIEQSQFGRVIGVKLLENWSLSNANLSGLSVISNVLTPWQFYGVNYLDPESRASQIGSIEHLYGTIEVVNSDWVGHFKSYDGQLVSAEFEKM